MAEAYRRHGGAVHRVARRVAGDPALAEEITQEVFLRLWREPERYDPERGSLQSYLLAQAHSRAVDLLRSEGSRRRREEREAQLTSAPGYDLEGDAWSGAIAIRVRQALDALPADERRAIELAYYGGYTYREVAQRLDQPEGTVKSRIRSGLRRLRPALAADVVEVDEAGRGGDR